MRNKLLTVGILCAVLAGSVGPALASAQVTPGTGPIDYGPTITTDREKLFACYSLIEQMIGECSYMYEVARLAPSLYMAKYKRYVNDEFDPRIRQLFRERDYLKQSIIDSLYSEAEWAEVGRDLEQFDEVCRLLFGDKFAEANKPTLASCGLLQELKAIDMTKLEPMPDLVDPTEDFTTYTEVDEGSDVSISADQVTYTNLASRELTYYLYYDMGVGHFDGDFEHLIRVYWDEMSVTSGLVGYWAVGNSIGDIRDIIDVSGDCLAGYFYYATTPERQLYIREVDGGTSYTDYYVCSLDQEYYLEFFRDDDDGTYGTLYCYIATDGYYHNGGNPEDVLSVVLHSSKKDYRYIYGLTGYDTDQAAKYTTGWQKLLDLQEGAGPTAVPYSFGYIMGA